MVRRSAALVAMAALPFAIASELPIVTHHVGAFNGKQVRYAASIEATGIPDKSGKLSARLVSFAYTAEDVSDPRTRPVMFVFNGGPITASLWLHIGVMGPKRVAVPDDLNADPSTYKLVDNSYSPLDVVDLVFVDPASTGYSRVLPGTAPENFYSVAGDGQQIAAFISAWLTGHKRRDSRCYILGESYGTIRAAEVAAQLAELPEPVQLDGVVLMGQALNIIEYRQRPQNIISFAASLPTLAAIGWYHNKVDRAGKTVDAFVEEAWSYAQTDYLTALFAGNAISVEERDRVATRLEQFTGIPAAYYREHNLRITKEQYRIELLKNRGLLLGRVDGRYVAPVTSKGNADDPANVIQAPFERLFFAYVENELGAHLPDIYVVAVNVPLESWKWGGSGPFADWPYSQRLLKVMNANPRFHVLIGNGYYDTETTVGAAEYLVRQAGWTPDRAAISLYEGGHMAYTVASSAKKFTDDIRRFISRL